MILPIAAAAAALALASSASDADAPVIVRVYMRYSLYPRGTEDHIKTRSWKEKCAFFKKEFLPEHVPSIQGHKAFLSGLLLDRLIRDKEPPRIISDTRAYHKALLAGDTVRSQQLYEDSVASVVESSITVIDAQSIPNSVFTHGDVPELDPDNKFLEMLGEITWTAIVQNRSDDYVRLQAKSLEAVLAKIEPEDYPTLVALFAGGKFRGW